MQLKFVWIIGVVAGSLLAGDAAKEVQEASIVNQYKITVTEAAKEGSLYAAKGTAPSRQGDGEVPVEFYLTEDKAHIIFGKAYDVEGNLLTVPIENIGRIEKEALFKWGEGEKKYYVFTDPECPYCKRMEQQVASLDKKVGTFYFFLYPLEFHKEAVPMSMHILNQEGDGKRFEALIGIANGEKRYKEAAYKVDQMEQYRRILERQTALGNELGVRNTDGI